MSRALAHAVSGVKVSAWEASLRRFLFGLVLLCAAAYYATGAVTGAVANAKLISNQFENTYPESPAIYTAILAATTGHFYYDLQKPPYATQPYGPLYYVLNWGIARAEHLDPDRIARRARLLSFTCFLLSGVAVFLIGRKLAFSIPVSVVAGLMLLAQPAFDCWNVTVRPDMPCLLAMLGCLYFGLEEKPNAKASLAVSGLFAAAAFLIKQSAIAAPIAIAAVLLLRKKHREAAWLALSGTLPVLLMCGFLLCRHEPFMQQLISVGRGLWSVRDGVRWVLLQTADGSILAPLVIGAIGFAKAIRGDQRSQIIAAFAVTNWCVGLGGVPQLGGAINYLLPGLAGCALLLPFTAELIRRKVGAKGLLISMSASLVIITLVWNIYGWSDAYEPTPRFAVAQQETPGAALRPFRILSDRPYYNLQGRDPELLDPFFMHSLELAGHWNSEPIVESVRRGDYDLVILDCLKQSWAVCNYRGVAYFSAPVVKAINENYSVLCSTATAWVLKPRSRDVNVTPETLGPALAQSCDTELRGIPPALFFPRGTR